MLSRPSQREPIGIMTRKQPLLNLPERKSVVRMNLESLHPRKRDSVVSGSSQSDEEKSSPCSPLKSNTSNDATCDERFDSWPVKCSFVLKELLYTEKVYVHDVGDIVRGYLSPMYSHLLSSGDTPNFIQTVFGNIVKIHQMHLEFLEALQSCCADPHKFGMVFVQWDFLTQYTIYCTNYSKGNRLLEKTLQEDASLKQFIQQCQREVGHSLCLSSQLIKPVQRILKYRLLLEELTKHFDPHHYAHKTLKDALDKMSSVAEQINAAFNDTKSPAKSSPGAIARKRSLQLRDLQKSRSIEPPTVASAPNSVQKSYLLLISNGSGRNGSSTKLETGYSYLKCSPTQMSSSSNQQPCCISKKNHRHSSGSMPCVHELKSYFESLTTSKKEGEIGKGKCNSGESLNDLERGSISDLLRNKTSISLTNISTGSK